MRLCIYFTLHFEGASFESRPRKYVSIAPYEICKDTAHLEKIFQDFIDQGGEGVILRDPASPNQPGRSSGYLKHKVKNYYY